MARTQILFCQRGLPRSSRLGLTWNLQEREKALLVVVCPLAESLEKWSQHVGGSCSFWDQLEALHTKDQPWAPLGGRTSFLFERQLSPEDPVGCIKSLSSPAHLGHLASSSQPALDLVCEPKSHQALGKPVN